MNYPYGDGYIFADCDMRLFHVSGSLFKLTPERHFELPVNGSTTCSLAAQGYQVTKSDSIPKWYVAAEGMQAKNIKSTENENLEFVGPMDEPQQYLRFSGDVFTPFSPEERFQLNLNSAGQGIALKEVLPTPVYIKTHNRSVTIDNTWVVLQSSVFSKEEKLIAGIYHLLV